MRKQEEIQALVEQYETMVRNSNVSFIDEESFEDIVDHYMRSRKYRKALDTLDIAKTQHPFHVLFLVMKAQVHTQMGENQIALDVLEHAVSMDPMDGDIPMTRGSIYSQMGLNEKAIACFEEARNLGIPEEEVNSSIAAEHINQGDFDEAAELLCRALEINPDFQFALHELSYCYDMLDDKDESIEFFTKLTDQRPYNSLIWFNLGVAYSRAGLYERAIESYDYALVIDETFPMAYYNKANALAGLERYEEAIACYQETFKYEEPRGDTYYFIGECYEHLRHWEQAMVFYHKAVRLDPNIADGWLGIGIVLDQEGRQQESVHYIKKALDLEPNNAEYWYIFGDLQSKLGFFEECEMAYQRVTELSPENSGIWLDYSRSFFEQARFDAAIEALAEGIKYHPDNAELHYRMSAYLLNQGKEQEALAYLHLALGLDYSKHNTLFDFLPQLRDAQQVLEVIASYKK